MFVPERFAFTDELEIFSFINAYNFAVLVTHGDGGFNATHVPVVLDEEASCLYAHLAKANPQVRALQEANEALLIFSGEHAYISPNWYKSKNLVPTWNYSAVHVSVEPHTLDVTQTVALLQRLSAQHEASFAEPWTSEQMSPGHLNALHGAIVGFRFEIMSVQAKQKLSQDKAPEDRQSVIEGLQTTAWGQGVANDMLRLENNRPKG